MKKNQLILMLQADDTPEDIEVGFSPNHPDNDSVKVYSINVIGLYTVNEKEVLVLQSDNGEDFINPILE